MRSLIRRRRRHPRRRLPVTLEVAGIQHAETPTKFWKSWSHALRRWGKTMHLAITITITIPITITITILSLLLLL